jgi:glycosyltransferase involved in cell wall biosynthesis
LMKVAICTLSQNVHTPTGLLSWFLQLARYFPTICPGMDFRFITSEETRRAFEGHATDVKTDIVGWDSSYRFRRLFSEHVLVGRHLRRHGYDVLLVANAGTAPLYLPRSVKLVQCVYGLQRAAEKDIHLSSRLYRNLFFARTVSRADCLVVNSEYSRAQLVFLMPHAAPKIRVIPHGYDSQVFHPAPLKEDDIAAIRRLGLAGPFILFVSQVYPYKNVHTAVEAFCRFVTESGLPHRMAIVGKFSDVWGGGKSYREKLLEIARSYQLEDRLVFCAAVPGETLRALYAAADVYVQPSLAETFGRTSLEAMACGCPIVAANAAATPEVVGDAGLYFDGPDVSAATAALLKLTQDSELRARCVRRGLERAERFSLREEIRQLTLAMAEVAQL